MSMNVCLVLMNIWLVSIECMPGVDVASVDEYVPSVNEHVPSVDEHLVSIN